MRYSGLGVREGTRQTPSFANTARQRTQRSLRVQRSTCRACRVRTIRRGERHRGRPWGVLGDLPRL